MDLTSDEVVRRLQARVAPEGPARGTLWDITDRGYVGGFKGNTFWIRIARRAPQFYATHVFGRIEERPAGSAVVIHFGHRQYATFVLWIMRALGLLLVGGALLAGMRQPVFLLGALWVVAVTSFLLWIYRLRSEDKDRLRSLVVASTRTDQRPDDALANSVIT